MTPRRVLRLALPALMIVAVLIAIRLFAGSSTVERDGLTYATGGLAQALEANGDRPGVRLLAEFVAKDGRPCRAFVAGDHSGIACREHGGWHLRVIRAGVSLDDPGSVGKTEAALRRSAAEMSAQ